MAEKNREFIPGEPTMDSIGGTPWYRKKKIVIPLIVVAIFVGLNQFVEEVETTTPPSATQSPEVIAPVEEVEVKDPRDTEWGLYSEEQFAFVNRIEKGRKAIDDAETDLAGSVALRERDADLCKILGNNTVVNWVGTIRDVGANGEGNAHVDIELADNVRVKTWNNSFSDLFDNTLIPPSSKFFDNLVTMKDGDKVTWSGRFLSSSRSCLKKGNLTNTFYGIDPQFIVKFSDIKLG
jgi:hypothetical protein